jgi:hypothetical protein
LPLGTNSADSYSPELAWSRKVQGKADLFTSSALGGEPVGVVRLAKIRSELLS